MKDVKVLVITPQYAPDFGPSVPIYTELCEDLTRLGCNVTVSTVFPHYGGSDKWAQYSNRIYKSENLNGVRVIRTYVYAVPKSALWRRLLYHASINISSGFASALTMGQDIVIADSPVLWSGLPLLIKSSVQRIPYIYVIHDIYPDVLEKLGVIRSPSILKLIGQVENFFYRKSAAISVLSDGFKENLIQKGVPADKIVVIPVCADVDFIRPLEKENELRQKWGVSGKFVVLYAGNMGLSQGLENVLQAAGRLKDHPEIAFIFVGEGAMKDELQNWAQINGLENVSFFPFLPRQKVPLVYASADVCLVSLNRDIVMESVPSKTYTIMSSGRPIIATVDGNSEVGCLLDKSQGGICIEPGNPAVLSQVILELSQNVDLCQKMGEQGRKYVVEHYSRRVAAKKYHDLIQQFHKKAQI